MIDNNTIQPDTLAILFICELNDTSIRVVNTIQFKNPFSGLDAYANTPNPESQLVTGATRGEMMKELDALRARFNTPQFIEELKATI